MRKPVLLAIVLLCVVILIGILIIFSESPAQPDNEELWAMIPSVMVDGKIYMTTGYESKTAKYYEGSDGTITSSVPGHEMPTQNDQSNFGMDYLYRYGSVDGALEVLIGDEWWIYATEELRDRMFSPSTRYSLLFAANTSLQQSIVLTEDKPYWCITVENEGTEAIKVEIAGVVYKIEPGVSAILGTDTMWEPGTYTVSFATAGSSGMEGRAACEATALPEDTINAIILQN